MYTSGLIAVAIGAVLGAWARWGLSIMFNPLLPSLPLGTLAANLIGAYLVGVAVAFFEKFALIPVEARLFVITGFMGALTTFSTFSAEEVNLLFTGQYAWWIAHMIAHLAGSIILTIIGILSVRWFA